MKATCGAKTRSGGECRRAPTKTRSRCRLHGGAAGSGAPFGSRNGNYRHGRYSREAREARKLHHANGAERLRAAELRVRGVADIRADERRGTPRADQVRGALSPQGGF